MAQAKKTRKPGGKSKESKQVTNVGEVRDMAVDVGSDEAVDSVGPELDHGAIMWEATRAGAKVPKRGEDGYYTLTAPQTTEIAPMSARIIKTGLTMAVTEPEDRAAAVIHADRIEPTLGMSGVVLVGIDTGGEVSVVLYNTTRAPVKIPEGAPIAAIAFARAYV